LYNIGALCLLLIGLYLVLDICWYHTYFLRGHWHIQTSYTQSVPHNLELRHINLAYSIRKPHLRCYQKLPSFDSTRDFCYW